MLKCISTCSIESGWLTHWRRFWGFFCPFSPNKNVTIQVFLEGPSDSHGSLHPHSIPPVTETLLFSDVHGYITRKSGISVYIWLTRKSLGHESIISTRQVLSSNRILILSMDLAFFSIVVHRRSGAPRSLNGAYDITSFHSLVRAHTFFFP